MKSSKTRNLDQYREIYTEKSAYGRSSEGRARELWTILSAFADSRKAGPLVVLDFGCGRSELVDRLAEFDRTGESRFIFHRYDPAIPEYSKCPVERADFVINTDVLEHLDEDEVDLLLGDIFALTDSCYFRISTRPARKTLPNGENAHATVQAADWWLGRISAHAKNLTTLPAKPDQLVAICFSDATLGPQIARRLAPGPLMALKRLLFQ